MFRSLHRIDSSNAEQIVKNLLTFFWKKFGHPNSIKFRLSIEHEGDERLDRVLSKHVHEKQSSCSTSQRKYCKKSPYNFFPYKCLDRKFQAFHERVKNPHRQSNVNHPRRAFSLHERPNLRFLRNCRRTKLINTKLNGDGSFDFEEFIRITRHVEKAFYLKHKISGLKEIFETFAEEEEDEKVITPLGFKKLCRYYRIYGLKSQEEFLKRTKDKGIVSDVDSLVKNWRLAVQPKIKIL